MITSTCPLYLATWETTQHTDSTQYCQGLPQFYPLIIGPHEHMTNTMILMAKEHIPPPPITVGMDTKLQ